MHGGGSNGQRKLRAERALQADWSRLVDFLTDAFARIVEDSGWFTVVLADSGAVSGLSWRAASHALVIVVVHVSSPADAVAASGCDDSDFVGIRAGREGASVGAYWHCAIGTHAVSILINDLGLLAFVSWGTVRNALVVDPLETVRAGGLGWFLDGRAVARGYGTDITSRLCLGRASAHGRQDGIT